MDITFKQAYKGCDNCPIQAICNTALVDAEELCSSYGDEEKQKELNDYMCSEMGIIDPYDCC